MSHADHNVVNPRKPKRAAIVLSNPAVSSTISRGYKHDPAFTALVVAGGQSPMFTFERAENLHAKFAEFYATGKPTAALCHGTAVLRFARLSDGMPQVQGKTVTGFANNYVQAGLWKGFAIRDGNLITGQQNFSGTETAELVVEAVGR